MDILVKLDDQHTSKSKEEKLEVINREIERFSQFMSTVGDWKAVGPLNEMEKVIIRTYLIQKLNGRIDEVKSDGTR
jgi:hypothetical protein